MTGALFMLIAMVVAVLGLFVGGAVALREAETPGDLAMLSAIVVLFAAVGGMVWPLTVLVGGLWGGLLVCKQVAKTQEKQRRLAHRAEQAQAFQPEADAAKYRRMAREERDLARLHRDTPELAQLHEQTAQHYDGLAAIYSR